LESAINAAREKGIFITAAAGNDTTNIDIMPQYPAYYAGQYYIFETIDVSGEVRLDSIKHDNVISIASIDSQNQLSQFSNKGKQAKNKQRNYQQVWSDFEANWLVDNPLLLNATQTGKQIEFAVEEAIIEGCTNPNDVNYFPFANEDDGSCVTTNIEDKAIGFEIYPNPSNGVVQLTFQEYSNLPKQISVIDCLGKSVLSINSFDSMIQMNLAKYPKGIYFIRVNSRDKSINRKLILK